MGAAESMHKIKKPTVCSQKKAWETSDVVERTLIPNSTLILIPAHINSRDQEIQESRKTPSGNR